MNIVIREYKSSDYPALIRILKSVYDAEIDQGTLENYYLSPKRVILLAEIDGCSVEGCAFVEVQEDKIRPHRILYVTYVAVNSTFRSHGVGKKLFEAIEEKCKEARASAIELTSANHREGAHRFYEAIGFTRKKTTVFIKEIRQ